MYAIYSRREHTLKFFNDENEPVVRSPKGTYLPVKAISTLNAKDKVSSFDEIVLYVHKRKMEHKYIYKAGSWHKVGKVVPIKTVAKFKVVDYKEGNK